MVVESGWHWSPIAFCFPLPRQNLWLFCEAIRASEVTQEKREKRVFGIWLKAAKLWQNCALRPPKLKCEACSRCQMLVSSTNLGCGTYAQKSLNLPRTKRFPVRTCEKPRKTRGTMVCEHECDFWQAMLDCCFRQPSLLLFAMRESLAKQCFPQVRSQPTTVNPMYSWDVNHVVLSCFSNRCLVECNELGTKQRAQTKVGSPLDFVPPFHSEKQKTICSFKHWTVTFCFKQRDTPLNFLRNFQSFAHRMISLLSTRVCGSDHK